MGYSDFFIVIDITKDRPSAMNDTKTSPLCKFAVLFMIEFRVLGIIIQGITINILNNPKNRPKRLDGNLSDNITYGKVSIIPKSIPITVRFKMNIRGIG